MIKFHLNIKIFFFFRNTSNIQSSSVSTHSDKVTKSGRIDDDFFENLPDFDVNELSTSKKRKGAKKSLSTIADYLTSSTLTSNAGKKNLIFLFSVLQIITYENFIH